MAHFAEVIDGVVNRVIVIEESQLDTGLWGSKENWIQCSYNTKGGIHYNPDTNEPDGGIPLRKNFPRQFWTYDKERDAFISPKPFPSWILNEDTCLWESPIPIPDPNSVDHIWLWIEDEQRWAKSLDGVTEYNG